MTDSLTNNAPSDAPLHVAWKVKALTSPDGPEISCVVLEVSDGGARLSVPANAAALPTASLFSPRLQDKRTMPR
jgi:hypothetical protein